jgi:N-methylhydantoinase A
LALDQAEIDRICAQVVALKPESIAVCLLHSYINPLHEQRLGEALRQALPGVYLSLSHEILRQFREYERTSTTVVNSYIGPRVSSYLEKLERELKAKQFAGTLLIMQSNGGVTSVGAAASMPVTLMESGPVGGVIATADLGERLGYDKLISFDMGGTTAKTSLVNDKTVAIAEGYYVNGYASGHPVMLPVVDIIEVGAGGGSIGWIDQDGRMKVGPQSAGASPGPVCYRTGGTEPTVTDANLVLGRIDGSQFMGGEMPLDVEASRQAIKTRLADPLNLTVEETALGMLRIAVAHMTLSVRGVSIERGYDPRDFVMVATGGNGGLHAPLIARELSIPRVVIPVLPALCSAVGMLMTDLRHDYVRTFPSDLAAPDFAGIREVADGFIRTGAELLSAEGIDASQHDMHLSLDVRYTGQDHYLNVPVSDDDLRQGAKDAILARFKELHRVQFGETVAAHTAEIVNVRVSAHGLRSKLKPNSGATLSANAPRRRKIFLTDPKAALECPVYQRASLAAGTSVTGPAVIEEDTTTVLLLPGDTATMAPSGEIIIDIGDK